MFCRGCCTVRRIPLLHRSGAASGVAPMVSSLARARWFRRDGCRRVERSWRSAALGAPSGSASREDPCRAACRRTSAAGRRPQAGSPALAIVARCGKLLGMDLPSNPPVSPAVRITVLLRLVSEGFQDAFGTGPEWLEAPPVDLAELREVVGVERIGQLRDATGLREGEGYAAGGPPGVVRCGCIRQPSPRRLLPFPAKLLVCSQLDWRFAMLARSLFCAFPWWGGDWLLFHDLSVSIALSVALSVAEAVDRCGIKGYWEW